MIQKDETINFLKASKEHNDLAIIQKNKGISNKKIFNMYESTFKDNLIELRSIYITYQTMITKFNMLRYLEGQDKLIDDIESCIELADECNAKASLEGMSESIYFMNQAIEMIHVYINQYEKESIYIADSFKENIDDIIPSDLSFSVLIDDSVVEDFTLVEMHLIKKTEDEIKQYLMVA